MLQPDRGGLALRDQRAEVLVGDEPALDGRRRLHRGGARAQLDQRHLAKGVARAEPRHRETLAAGQRHHGFDAALAQDIGAARRVAVAREGGAAVEMHRARDREQLGARLGVQAVEEAHFGIPKGAFMTLWQRPEQRRNPDSPKHMPQTLAQPAAPLRDRSGQDQKDPLPSTGGEAIHRVAHERASGLSFQSTPREMPSPTCRRSIHARLDRGGRREAAGRLGRRYLRFNPRPTSATTPMWHFSPRLA